MTHHFPSDRNEENDEDRIESTTWRPDHAVGYATVFGAGVTGLTVAHELVERGFDVEVIEPETTDQGALDCVVGGMAASQYGYAPAVDFDYQQDRRARRRRRRSKSKRAGVHAHLRDLRRGRRPFVDHRRRLPASEAIESPILAFPVTFRNAEKKLEDRDSIEKQILCFLRGNQSASGSQSVAQQLQNQKYADTLERLRKLKAPDSIVGNLLAQLTNFLELQEDNNPEPDSECEALLRDLEKLIETDPAVQPPSLPSDAKQGLSGLVRRADAIQREQLRAALEAFRKAGDEATIADYEAWLSLHWIAFTTLVVLQPEFVHRDRKLGRFLFDLLQREEGPQYGPRDFEAEFAVRPLADALDPDAGADTKKALSHFWTFALIELERLPVHTVRALVTRAARSAHGAKPSESLQLEAHGFADPDRDWRPAHLDDNYQLSLARASFTRYWVKTLVRERLAHRYGEDEAARWVPHDEKPLRRAGEGEPREPRRLEIEIFGHGQNRGWRNPDGAARDEDPTKRRAIVRLGMVELPGEHGYRFFPSFYRHLFDTMRRTPQFEWESITRNRPRRSTFAPDPAEPVEISDRTVFENLHPTRETAIASRDVSSRGRASVVLPRTRVQSLEAIRQLRERLLGDLRLNDRDLLAFELKLFRFLTASHKRRATYERQSWLEFIGAEAPDPARPGEYLGTGKYSPEFVRQMRSLPIALVGMRARDADAHTYGNTMIQLLLDQLSPGDHTDMTLNGPTTEAWLRHWRAYLDEQGVRFYIGRLEGFRFRHGRYEPSFREDPERPSALWDPDLGPVRFRTPRPEIRDRHYYVVATDVESARAAVEGLPPYQDIGALLSMDLERAQGPDGFLPDDDRSSPIEEPEAPGRPLQTFSGVQFYFQQNIRFFHGHVYFIDSEWGLTSISQPQFWRDGLGPDEPFITVLSVDIGNWYRKVARVWRPGEAPTEKAAWECDRGQLADEVWEQIRRGLPDGEALPDPAYYRVDRNLEYFPDNLSRARDQAREAPLRPSAFGETAQLWDDLVEALSIREGAVIEGAVEHESGADRSLVGRLRVESYKDHTLWSSVLHLSYVAPEEDLIVPRTIEQPIGTERELKGFLRRVIASEAVGLWSGGAQAGRRTGGGSKARSSRSRELAAFLELAEAGADWIRKVVRDGLEVPGAGSQKRTPFEGALKALDSSTLRELVITLTYDEHEAHPPPQQLPAAPERTEVVGVQEIIERLRQLRRRQRFGTRLLLHTTSGRAIEVKHDEIEAVAHYLHLRQVLLPRIEWGLVTGVLDSRAGRLRDNRYPYLVTVKGKWQERPGRVPLEDSDAGYAIGPDHIVLAGTYMKTYTRLTTMESANESGRHAVNAILSDLGGTTTAATPAETWNPEDHEPGDLRYFKRLDEDLYDRGLPHMADILDLDKLPELLFPNDKPARRMDLWRLAIARMTRDDYDALPLSLANGAREVAADVYRWLRSYFDRK